MTEGGPLDLDNGLDDNAVVILCRRAEYFKAPTATQITADCGHEVSVADSSFIEAHKQEAAGHTVEYQCLPCGLKSAYETGAFEVTPVQAEKLLSTLRAELTEGEIKQIEEVLK